MEASAWAARMWNVTREAARANTGMRHDHPRRCSRLLAPTRDLLGWGVFSLLVWLVGGASTGAG